MQFEIPLAWRLLTSPSNAKENISILASCHPEKEEPPPGTVLISSTITGLKHAWHLYSYDQ